MFEKVTRPWGFYYELEKGKNYKIKKLVLNPFSATSLQIHNFRNEYFFVCNGVLHLYKEGKFFEANKFESLEVEKRRVHRVFNNQNCFLEIIEIQTGSLLTESDIIRIEDFYSRT